MSTYSIKDLEGLTNLKAHTIRTWELRYALLKPRRTSTNIRFYDDEQLKKLLNVCTLMNAGMKISHISKLTSKEISKEIDELMKGQTAPDTQVETIINQALIAISTYNEPLFDKIFANAILRFGMVQTYLNIIYPLMMKTGIMWSNNDLIPAQEHFFSNLVKQKLFAAIDALPPASQLNQTWVLFLNENEQHEIGLLFAAYLLRQQGKRVIYLGTNVPYNNLSAVVKQCNPTHIYTFITRNMPGEELGSFINALCHDFKKLEIGVSGRTEMVENKIHAKNIHWIKEIPSLMKMAQKNV